MSVTQPELFVEFARHAEGPIAEAYSILTDAVTRYRPSAIFGLFSGGHDSLCATHLASTLDGFTATVHINTGIGIPRTRQFVRDTCREHGWPLLEYHPPPYIPGRCKACRKAPGARAWQDCPACVRKRHPGIDYERLPAYEAMTLHHGFAGPGGHTMMYNRLKERCLRRLIRDHKRFPRDKIVLVGGMRKAESVRRMGNAEAVGLEGVRVWVAPIVWWTDDDKDWYINANKLKRNPVVKRLCMSGECLCGAFSRPGEIAEITAICPETATYIHALEARARQQGVHAVWGTRHPNSRPEKAKRDAPGQMTLFGLCSSCHARHDAEEAAVALRDAGCQEVFGEYGMYWQLPNGNVVGWEEAIAWKESTP